MLRLTPARVWTSGIVRRIVGRVTEPRTCALCGKPIGQGEAWLQRDDAVTDVAHAGCVYSDEPSTEVQARWRPGDVEATKWP